MLATTQWPLERAANLTSLVWVCVLWLPESLMGLSALCLQFCQLIQSDKTADYMYTTYLKILISKVSPYICSWSLYRNRNIAQLCLALYQSIHVDRYLWYRIDVLSNSVDPWLVKKDHVLNHDVLPHTSPGSGGLWWTVLMGTIPDIIRPMDVATRLWGQIVNIFKSHHISLTIKQAERQGTM